MHLEQAIASIRFDPLVPVWLIALLALLCVLVLAPAAWRRARGTVWRGLAFAVLLLWLAGPRLVQETRETLPDVGLLVVDQTASMQVGNRASLAEAAHSAIEQQAAKLPDLELRTITVPESGNAGTRLFAAIDRALADIPRTRLAGVVAITDGQVHDIPETAPGGVPLNVLIPARGEEIDRRLRVIEAPSIRNCRSSRDAAGRDRGSRRAASVRRRPAYDPARRRSAPDREPSDRPRACHRGADHARRADRARVAG